VQSAQADVGQSVSLAITLSDAATGLSGYDLTVSLADPAVATIASTTLPGFGLVSQQALSASSVRLRAADLMRLVEVGAGQVLLATLTLDGLKPGQTAVTVSVARLEDEGGFQISHQVVAGSVTILNVVPSVDAGAASTVDDGDVYSGSGSFVDTADDTWTATVDYGDGSGVQPLTLTGTTFALGHTYSALGVFVVSVSVTDSLGAVGTATTQVEVLAVYPTLPGMSAPARDLDGDGTAEDLNGNSRLDFADIVALFEHMNSPEVQSDIAAFDFNGNGLVDMADVQTLFDVLIAGL
jgi:PKD repeat protein